jgi:hypothetical protein
MPVNDDLHLGKDCMKRISTTGVILFLSLLSFGVTSCNSSGSPSETSIPVSSNQQLTTRSITVGTTPPIVRPADYDYGASIIDTGNERQIWWCGGSRTASVNNEAVADPDYPLSDGILYAKYNKTTNQVLEAPRTVLFSKPNANTWDRSYVCDPSVVKGVFNYNSQTYSYALYYTATDRGPGSAYSPDPNNHKPKGSVDPVLKDYDGTNNRIGVAFSNDGKAWVRYANNPIIYPNFRSNPPQTTQTNSTDAYGAGQSGVYNANGLGAIWIVHTDTSDGSTLCGASHIYVRTSTNGVNFGAPQEVSRNGLIGPNTKIANGDFAFDPNSHYWYGTFRMDSDSRPAAWRNTFGDIYYNASNGCGRINFNSQEAQQFGVRVEDRESYQVGIYRMPETQFPTGTWEAVGYVNTNLTGYPLNHNVALARDLYGNVYFNSTGVEPIFSAGSNIVSDWDLQKVNLTANPSTIALKRYYGATNGYHKVTSGYVGNDDNWQLEQTLGYLNIGRLTNEGTSTVPLYGCQVGPKDVLTRDRFVSRDANCEGQYPLGINGFIYQQPVAGIATRAIYRCKTPIDHFVSTASNCEGQTVESLLGYVKINP